MAGLRRILSSWPLSTLAALFLLLSPNQAAAKHHRSHAAKAEFKRQHPCPATGQPRGACPGYVIDHITPLACGGADAPGNMQWQTKAEGRAKDKWERKNCQQRFH